MRKTAIIAATLLLGACGQHQDSDHNVTVTIPGANGSTVISGNGQLPTDLPSFVKAYPGAKVTATTTTPGGGVLAMESSDTPDKVMDFYKQAATEAGLPVQMDSAQLGPGNANGSHLILFGGQQTKKSLSVSVQPQNGVTKIAILYGMSAS